MNSRPITRPQRPLSLLDHLAERFQRESDAASLESVNRVRRMLFGVLPEDAVSQRLCSQPHLIRRSDTFSPSDAEKENL